MTNSLRLTHHVLLVRGYMFRSLVTIIRMINSFTSNTSCFIGARLHVSVFSNHPQAFFGCLVVVFVNNEQHN